LQNSLIFQLSGICRLTAFVAKSFRAASPYITIDPTMVRQALQWLQGVQATNGSFPEVGKVHHHDMQGGAASGLALTAYTLITFLQDKVRIFIKSIKVELMFRKFKGIYEPLPQCNQQGD